MKSKLAIILFLSLILSGCATTNYQSSINFLQKRINDVEMRLEQRDGAIKDLRYQIDQLADEVRQKDRIIEELQQENEEIASKPTGIIRIEVSTEKIQAALKNAGYYEGNVDGKIGDQTKAAIMQFQKANKIKADGIIGKQTWSLLQEHL